MTSKFTTKESLTNLAADGRSALNGTVRDSDWLRALRLSGPKSAEDTMDAINQNTKQQFALRLENTLTGKFHPTRMATFKDAVRHFNLFVRKRAPITISKIKSAQQHHSADSVGLGMMPFMYQIGEPATDADGEAFNAQWTTEGNINAGLNERFGVLFAPECMWCSEHPNIIMLSVNIYTKG
jgi:hypothetical protein